MLFFNLEKLNHLKKFDPSERSSFNYWHNHWLAYNLVAIKLKCWKWKYLFHDIEKPWLKLFLPYKKVQKFHRKYHKHHLEYRNPNKIDWEAMMIDWECGRFSKNNSPRTCREQVEELKTKKPNKYQMVKEHLIPLCDKFNI